MRMPCDSAQCMFEEEDPDGRSGQAVDGQLRSET